MQVNDPVEPARVNRTLWTLDGVKQPVIRIQRGDHFIAVPFQYGREMVDQVHDLCDEWDQQQRRKLEKEKEHGGMADTSA